MKIYFFHAQKNQQQNNRIFEEVFSVTYLVENAHGMEQKWRLKVKQKP